MKMQIIKHGFLALAIVTGFSAIVMFLWNILIPNIFGLAVINFWQALGLLALARLLFGGIGGKFWMGAGMHSLHSPIHEKWMKMTPEERKDFIQRRHHMHSFGYDFFNTDKPEKES